METTANRLETIRNRVDAAARLSGRDPADVVLIAVSKTFPAENVADALEAGCRIFGENRVQEAEAKWPPLRNVYDDVELHLIGPLQSNKAETAAATFDVIHSLDRPKLAETLARLRDMGTPPPRLFIQVNIGDEPQKSGVELQDAATFIQTCRDRLELPVVGLMCIPPAGEPPSPYFALLAKIARDEGLAGLSMGMSADFEMAIGLGATHIRLGEAVFGARG